MGYSSLAAVYDKLTFNVNYKKRAEYIKNILYGDGIKSGLVLDLACGTGSVSKYLSEWGYEMILCDLSPEMLALAREKNPRSLILNQDMTRLDLYGTVNAVICSLDSINHLTKEDDVKKTFERASLFTEKGGAFLFDINTPFKAREILASNTFIYEKDDVYCVWRNSYDETSSITDISLDIFKESGGYYKRTKDYFSERAYKIEDLVKWLSGAGFYVKNIYDDMTFNKPKDNSQRVYIDAVKL